MGYPDAFERQALELIRATQDALGLGDPLSPEQREVLSRAIAADTTFVSEPHPKFAPGHGTMITSYNRFEHYYARMDAIERKATVADALKLLARETTHEEDEQRQP